MTTPARRSAHRALRDVGAERLDLSSAIARARQGLADPRDRALAGEIAIGTLRWRAALDYQMGNVSLRPIERIDPEVLDVIRAATYQLLFLDRVPKWAIVHDAVELTREIGKSSACTFVNAVLRRLAESPQKKTLPSRPEIPASGILNRVAALDYLAVTLSHPLWLVKRWFNRYGFDAATDWVRQNNEPAPVTLCANALKTNVKRLAERLLDFGVVTESGCSAPHALTVIEGNPLATPLATEGWFLIQGQASQLITELVGATSDSRVLDTCAAPGGKSVGLAGAMENRGMLVVADFRPRRITLLKQTMVRCAVRPATVVRLNLSRPLPFGPIFDRVLVDAPCSGLGTIRRNPDIKWRRDESALAVFANRQREMLEQAAAVVRQGGWLIYATCSSEPEENEDVVESFLSDHNNFEPIVPTNSFVTPFLTSRGHLRTLPFRDQLEAVYAAILRRRIL